MLGPRFLLPAMGAITLACLYACGTGPRSLLAPNQPPEIEIVDSRGSPRDLNSSEVRVRWAARDPDGRVDRYEWALSDPGTVPGDGDWNAWHEPLWSSRQVPARTAAEGAGAAREPKLFRVRAVDERGARSDAAVLGLFSGNVAPTCLLTCPAPGSSLDSYRRDVQPSPTIVWSGYDPDGAFTTRPVKYKHILLTPNTPVSYQTALVMPDSVRRYYAPLNWAGWDSTSADTTFTHFSNLIPGQDYIFCVISFDELGDYSPIFSLSRNMLNMRVLSAGGVGPVLTMWSDQFYYEYSGGGWSTSPNRIVHTEVPAGKPVSTNWSGKAPEGAQVLYRWVLDPVDLFDETPRTDYDVDVRHWSSWSLYVTSCTLGPFNPQPPKRELHTLYIEARDNSSCDVSENRSLGIVQFAVASPAFRKPLLIVDDTRYTLDQKNFGTPCMNPPNGAWPTAAELDTFLYAQGGVPWKCYPPGSVSRPGLFSGYEFDTLGTRGYPTGVIPLSVLADYQKIVWLVDANGATKTGSSNGPANAITALRYMSDHNRHSALASYCAMGGDLWLVGGGGAYASLIPWNNTHNDNTPPAPGTTFSSANGELIPGRFVYDFAKWQSEVKVSSGPITFFRDRGRYELTPGPPAYQQLPAQMRAKSQALGDTFPPGRSFNPPTFFVTSFAVEYLSKPDRIMEDVDPSPVVYDNQSTLDTLYRAVGSSLVQPADNPKNVCMTRYSGPSSTHMIMTGFNIWNFSHVDCKAMVDAVLQGMWGLTPTAATPAREFGAAPPAWSPRRPAGAATRKEPPVGALTRGR